MTKTETKEAKAQAKAAKAHAKALRPWYKKKRFMVPLVAIALIAMISVASGGSTDGGTEDAVASSGNSDAAADKKEEAAADAPQGVGVGQAADDGKFRFTVQSLECGETKVGDDFLNKAAQGQFCMLSVTVENIGQESQYLFADNQYLFDAEGRKFSADGEATIYNDTDDRTIFEEINPGNTLSGVIVFDVPNGAEIVRAEMHDSAFSGGVSVSLN